MNLKTYLSVFLVFISINIHAQNKKPKLIVGVVVDQMRADYLDSFFPLRSKIEAAQGIERMRLYGVEFRQTYLGYMPSYTGPGHATIYTGIEPYYHGIIANDWYNRATGEMVYCVDDENYSGVGGEENSKSPHLLTYPTFGDKLKEQDEFSKVIGVALKDRAAILPAGKKGDYAFWLDGKSGDWVTSSYYTKELPDWVKQINKQQLVLKYLAAPWDLMYPKDSYYYKTTLADDNPYEGTFKGEDKPVFPHRLYDLMAENGGPAIIKTSPFGNTLTADFAKMAIVNENLGQDEHTDMLAISFSSTDYIGHMYGPGSLELEDTYHRFYFVMKDLLEFLNEQVGYDNYVLFLTSDHGVQYNPQYAKDSLDMDVGYVDVKGLLDKVNEGLVEKYKVSGLIENASNYQLYLNYSKIDSANLGIKEVKQTIKQLVDGFEGIAYCYTDAIELKSSVDAVMKLLAKGIMLERSGDVFLVFEEGWLAASEYGKTGTTHGSPYVSDTHIPLIVYGSGIEGRPVDKKVQITELVAALYDLMGIEKEKGMVEDGTVSKAINR